MEVGVKWHTSVLNDCIFVPLCHYIPDKGDARRKLESKFKQRRQHCGEGSLPFPFLGLKNTLYIALMFSNKSHDRGR